MSEYDEDENGPPDAFVRKFCIEHAGHPLIAWVRFFDRDNDKKVVLAKFVKGMDQMGYDGNAEALFKRLDEDDTGYLTISEISPSSSDLWSSFQHWCGKTFFSDEDMIEKLSGRKFKADKKHGSKVVVDGGMTKKQFYNFASSLGWYGGFEQVLFMTMDPEKKGKVYQEKLFWFQDERNRQIKKAKLKSRGKNREGMSAMRKRLHALHSLQAFTSWLRYHYGPCLFHPWRRGIDKDGSMTVSRLELFTFCKNAGWRGDINALWHGLDGDDSGMTSLDEFAGKEARQLALFKKWIDGNFGNVRKMFNACVVKCRKKGQAAKQFDKHDFSFAVASIGFHEDAGEIFDILDWEEGGDQLLTYKELRFLDSWEPVEWLGSPAKYDEAEAFKACLFAKCKHPLKAWRLLDEEGSGKVNYKEFQIASYKIQFRGDIMGAWNALDDDASGYVSLAEIDPRSAKMLADFRRWANFFFGSVAEAFSVLDSDGGGSLSRAEFKKSVTKYAFRGDREGLFTLLDICNDGDISVDEMGFLDEWEITEVCDEPIPTFQEVEYMLKTYRADSDASSEHSNSEGELEHVGYQRAAPRGQVLLTDTDVRAFANENVFKAMPGNTLVDLLGVFNSRPRVGLVPPLSGSHMTMTTGMFHQMSIDTTFTGISACSKGSTRIGSHLCSQGGSPQRPRHHRLRKDVPPYVGGAAFMPEKPRRIIPSWNKPVAVEAQSSGPSLISKREMKAAGRALFSTK